MNRRAAELFERLGVHLDPLRPAAGLSIADQQIVEIAKALSIEARVIVMDEPTAALSAVEAGRLMDVARRLRDRGAAVVFVSHRLDEVFALCDRLTVMRDGATVAEALVADSSPGEVVRLMVGRALAELFPKVAAEVGATVLEVAGLTRDGPLRGRLVHASAPARSSPSPGSSDRAAARSCEPSSASTATTTAACCCTAQPLPPGDPARRAPRRRRAGARGPPAGGPADGRPASPATSPSRCSTASAARGLIRCARRARGRRRVGVERCS